MGNYKQDMIREIAEDIKKAGFRVFLAASGTYGFFTDAEGSRVISFQTEILSLSFSGNYKTDNPKGTGSGWQILEGYPKDFSEIFNSYPPHWAVGSAKWKFTTLDQHLATYQKSSKYQEI